MTEDFKPYIKTIKINAKTDYNKMFLNVTRNLNNKTAREHINKLKQNMEGIENSAYHFIDNSTTKDPKYSKTAYTVVDGNHRTTAEYEKAIEANIEFIIRPTIYDWGYFDYKLENVIKFYETNINNMRKQSNINVLEANAFQSNWVEYFNKNNKFQIGFEQATKKLSWTNVINTNLNARKMLKNKSISNALRGYSREELLEEFINGDKGNMLDFQVFLMWWIPISEMAKKEYKIGTLYSVPFMTAGYLIWLENQRTIKPEDGEKIIRFPRFMKLAKFCHAGQFSEFIKFILYAINYKNTRRRFTVFNEVGEEISPS
jgi:hypothetical protein